MKNIITIAIALISLFASSVHAEKLMGIGFAPTALGKTLDGKQFKDTTYVTVLYGDLSNKPMGLSWLYSGGVTLNKVDENANSDFVYGYTIANINASLNIGGGLFAYAGVGYSFEKGQVVSNGNNLKTTADNNQMNKTAGIGFMSGNVGGTLSFDSASEAISYNLVFKL